MPSLFESRTLTVAIERGQESVYEFVSNPENLPLWATTFIRSIRKINGDWLAETPQGTARIRFVEKNNFGILDHYVSPAPGVEIFVPMRVVANGFGCIILFTLFKLTQMSDQRFEEDARMVEADLKTLKQVLEGR